MPSAALYFQCVFCHGSSDSRPDCLNDRGVRFEPDVCPECARRIFGVEPQEETPDAPPA